MNTEEPLSFIACFLACAFAVVACTPKTEKVELKINEQLVCKVEKK